MAECAIQLSGFKNVDLFSQGVYQVRVRAYTDRSGRAAVPFALTELPLPPLPGSVNSEQLLPAHRRSRAQLLLGAPQLATLGLARLALGG